MVISQRCSYSDLLAFTYNILCSAGVVEPEAKSVSECLVWCSAAGLPNQGVWRLPVLLQKLASGGITSPSKWLVRKKMPAFSYIDGGAGFGHYLCAKATVEVCKTAKNQGIAGIALSNSNFCGALGFYLKLAADNDCVLFVFSNSFPKVAPYGGVKAVLGTNPLGVGFPGIGGEHLIIDMATASSAGSTITKAIENGTSLPEGIAVDSKGEAITDPRLVDQGALLPFGGAKGFGLALMVEMLAGVLTGSSLSKEIGSLYKHPDKPGGNGQLFIAISPSSYIDSETYESGWSRLREYLLADGNVRLPGVQKISKEVESQVKGVELDQATLDALSDLSKQHGVALPTFI
ncbi:Ldh family oxidoreductase [Aurantivibrio plasticivorans]